MRNMELLLYASALSSDKLVISIAFRDEVVYGRVEAVGYQTIRAPRTRIELGTLGQGLLRPAWQDERAYR